MSAKKTILVIDDEEMILDAVKVIMEDMGYDVTTYADPLEGQRAALEKDFDLILCDLRMPDRNGAEVTETILSKKKDAKILVITAYTTDQLAKRALDAGAVGMLKKPFEIAKIVSFLNDG